jgi:hypothetical protein
MEIQKLKSKKFKLALYFLPFLAMLFSCLNFIIYLSGTLEASVYIAFVIFQLFFLASLSAVLGNILTEALLLLSENKESTLRSLLYADEKLIPVRQTSFVVIFIICYIVLAQLLPYMNSLKLFMLAVPSLGIFFNAPYFLSGNVRLIGGQYFSYKKRLYTIISYKIGENGTAVLIADDGKLFDTGIPATGSDFKGLEAELIKNGLKSSSKTL